MRPFHGASAFPKLAAMGVLLAYGADVLFFAPESVPLKVLYVVDANVNLRCAAFGRPQHSALASCLVQ